MIQHWTMSGPGLQSSIDSRVALIAVELAGRAGFVQTLLSALEPVGGFEHCTVFRLEVDQADDVRCDVVDTASRHRAITAHRTSTLFAARFAHLDVNAAFVAEPRPQARVMASHFLAKDLPDAEYRHACYNSNGLGERLSLVARSPAGRSAVSLNLYRSACRGPMLEGQRDALLRCGPVLAASAARHAHAVRPVRRSAAEMVATLPGAVGLSPRERELCCLLVDDLSLGAAADRMNIRPTTAITLKKRAFARLGVRTREGLLRALAAHGGVMGAWPAEDECSGRARERRAT